MLSRDEARPIRDDDDVVALDLTAGDHDVVLKLHQRDGGWSFRAKLVDSTFTPPVGTYLALPGTNADDARALAERMSWLIVDRAFDARSVPPAYRPVLTVRYPEGAPRGVPLPVTAKLSGGSDALAFDVKAGSVAVTAAGVSDLVVTLPPFDSAANTGSATLETTVAGRVVKSTIAARPQSEQALVRAERALAAATGNEPWLKSGRSTRSAISRDGSHASWLVATAMPKRKPTMLASSNGSQRTSNVEWTRTKGARGSCAVRSLRRSTAPRANSGSTCRRRTSRARIDATRSSSGCTG